MIEIQRLPLYASLLALCAFLSVQVGATESNLQLLNLKNDTITIDTHKPAAYIFVGDFSCKECVTVLEHSILEQDSTQDIHIVLHTYPGASIIAKRKEIQQVGLLVKSRSFLFDISTTATGHLGKYVDGLFANFNISISPAVLLCFADREPVFLNYSDLFYGHDTLSTDQVYAQCAAKISALLTKAHDRNTD